MGHIWGASACPRLILGRLITISEGSEAASLKIYCIFTADWWLALNSIYMVYTCYIQWWLALASVSGEIKVN